VRRQSQLSEAVESRTVIGQAIGLLMQRYQTERERAVRSDPELAPN
jgi:AmiR/NasT family two-component response regulator